jgi:hypothetical protein
MTRPFAIVLASCLPLIVPACSDAQGARPKANPCEFSVYPTETWQRSPGFCRARSGRMVIGAAYCVHFVPGKGRG